MPKEARSEIIIFRLRKSHFDELVKAHKSIVIKGISTEDQFVRKIVLDFLKGYLAYQDPSKRALTPDG
jgi:hypothetical protein